MSALRPPTAFEIFLQRRQQAASESNAAPELRSPFNPAASEPADLTHALPQAPVSTSAAVAAASAAAAAPAASAATPRPSTLRATQGRPLPSNGNSNSNNNSSPQDRPSSRPLIRRSAPNLVPQVVASLPSPRASAADGQPAAGGGGGGGPPLPSAPPSTAVYGELASAAAYLASAASKLARGSMSDRSVAASYENLAQAAADLAASACLIRPLTSSNSGGGPHGGSNRRASLNLPTKLPETRSGSVGALPRAVDPIAAAAAAAAEAAAGTVTGGGGGGGSAAAAAAAATSAHQQQRHQQQQQQQPQNNPAAARSGAGGSSAGGRRGVNVPRFPGYNPLIHLMESSMPPPPPPGSAASQRPTTSSPITHQLTDSRALLQSAAAAGGGGNTSAASYLSHRQRRSSGSSAGAGSAAFPARRSSADGATAAAAGGGGGGNGPLFYPANLSRLPVLTIGPDGEYLPSGGFGAATVTPQAAAAGACREIWFNDQGGGGGGGGSGATLPHGGGAGAAVHRQRRGSGGAGGTAGGPGQSEWPAPGPLRRSESLPSPDLESEEVDGRYNKLLAALRERVYARGAGRVASVFRDLDRDGSGMLSRKDFAAALQAMNLGPAGLVDDKVVDLMLAAVDGGATGWRPLHVPYGDFVNALRFGTLPWRGHKRPCRHRQLADPDQPIGPPKTAGGLPPYSLAYGNNNNGDNCSSGGGGAAAAAGTAGGGGRIGRLDHNGDGVVEWAEFREALRRVGEQNRLQLSDQQLLKIYQDADPDFSTGVDYEAFVEAYGSADGPT
ncbi:hypothetical protein VOLCADRAFT_116531, partial [Volvox carteri f. nagariensis]